MAKEIVTLDIEPAISAELAAEVFRLKDRYYARHPEHLVIYVAAPYSASHPSQIQANVFEAFRIALAIFQRGHTPFVPHLLHYFDQYLQRVQDCSLHYETAMGWSDTLLTKSDAFFYHRSSPGVDREYVRARNLGLRVFRDIKEVPIITPTFCPCEPDVSSL